ncbi:SRPBCC family protein [Mycobacterium simiae]|uniref:SRPBCC family protein n=1 Tax=Mycobacterium simiae TaxID=1784 RepID=A0A5B1BM32_MYCSI|nr:SRPBCC family protein [Mycobacterium simiae]KAA1248915.1 SRPBCC family protein [Mycobacterium simiae]
MNDASVRRTAALASGLGAASVGLGLAEVLAPGRVAALAGVDDTYRSRLIIRALGLRECGHAAAILLGSPALVWTRVAGDALDIALLGAGVVRRGRGRRTRGVIAAIALTGIAGADLYATLRASGTGSARHANGAKHRSLRAAVTVRRSPEDAYRFWRHLDNLPSFMHHLQSVTVDAEGRSHWVANAPVGQSVQWDAQLVDDVPNQRIAWQSLPGSGIENGGSVEFAPAASGDGTEVRVMIGYHILGGAIGKAVATLMGESPEQQVNDDLRRFKQIMETGQVLYSDGSPEGTSAFRQMHQQAAQPVSEGASR